MLQQSMHHLASPCGASEVQIGAFLTGIKLGGFEEDGKSIAICAGVMKEWAVKLSLPSANGGIEEGGEEEEEEEGICDIVGTGGDGQNTFNVSTTAGIIVAGVGCRVYKVSSSFSLS